MKAARRFAGPFILMVLFFLIDGITLSSAVIVERPITTTVPLITRTPQELTIHNSLQTRLQQLGIVNLPASLDYSNLVTMRPQGASESIAVAAMVADAAFERQCPYAPDVSVEFMNRVWAANNKKYPFAILVDQGACTELSYPSYWNTRPYDPNASMYQEALNYRLASYTNPGQATGYPVDADELKRILVAYGPVFASAYEDEGIPFLVYGYDDKAKVFKAIGAEKTIPYGNVTIPPSSGWPRVLTVRWVAVPSLTTLVHPYVMRLQVEHTISRYHLWATAGIENAPYAKPLKIWTAINGAKAFTTQNYYEALNSLYLDVPLPSTWTQYWPPSKDHQWYIDIGDYQPLGTAVTGTIKKVEVAKRQIGAPPTVFTTAVVGNLTLTSGNTVRVYIPPKEVYSLTAAPDRAAIGSGQTIQITGKYTLDRQFTNTQAVSAPMANAKIMLTYENVRDDPKLTAITDAIGGFKINIPDLTATTTFHVSVITPAGGLLKSASFTVVVQ
jgi:hypothetical protein